MCVQLILTGKTQRGEFPYLFQKAGAGAGMGSHVLQRANYARFHSNQTLCQVISIITASSLGEVIQ